MKASVQLPHGTAKDSTKWWRRAADHHHVLAGAGGKPEHFGKLHLGHEEAVRRR